MAFQNMLMLTTLLSHFVNVYGHMFMVTLLPNYNILSWGEVVMAVYYPPENASYCA